MTAAFARAALDAHAVRVEAELARLIEPLDRGERDPALRRLVAAMRHAVLGGGKRLRPFLVRAAAELGPAEPEAVVRVGAAIELLHCYSLVHDDLPAMDDAATRRGRPSCHVAFDEATAILAGDALQALAFEALARSDWPASAELRAELVAGLARAAGAAGMCGGQALDLAAEGGDLDEAAILRLEALKTGALIGFACEAGARLAGIADAPLAAVRAFARELGLAFQITDDLLDATASAEELGKPAGADAARGKATLVRLLGEAGARARLEAVRERALRALDRFGPEALLLRATLDLVIERRR
ncbi:MAG: polyprenyl synthetase family protein [Geminicoccaceae bacterium]|nr:polyprenyl synthetase family protein [Geminicoccaceae bacterium]MCX7629889.1 polyprenyl synthetase family protein [Geminicoccaceae bacterium]MDW8124069.1 polyprenyl synthetase family protein [Geminicoccaceae bacterium]MDW8340268.1 polyprenyl synthetase family protein [Geminicoccaceae bacterium]